LYKVFFRTFLNTFGMRDLDFLEILLLG